MIIINPN